MTLVAGEGAGAHTIRLPVVILLAHAIVLAEVLTLV